MPHLLSETTRETFGRYRVLGLIGQGGMASLHLAELPGIEGFSKIVALKRVHPHLAASPELRRMFSTEAKLAARLDHPNIVQVHELGEVDGTYFIAMEYLPGEDLAAILQRTTHSARLPVRMAVWIAEQAARALHHAHELRDAHGRPAGLVHRDVTPSNIMLTYSGAVKLLDFGVAKSLGSDVATREGVFKGKLAYSSPEQVSGEPVDRRGDVFCLGIVLWECLTGQRLFAAPTDAERIDAVRMREILPPSSFVRDVPPGLDRVVLRALSRARSERFATALEFQLALGELADAVGRTSPEEAVAWLERAFGAERAALKRAIAQGQDVEANALKVARLADPSAVVSSDTIPAGPFPQLAPPPRAAPRTAWSTDVAGGSSLRPAPPPALRTPVSTDDIPLRFTPPPPPLSTRVSPFSGLSPGTTGSTAVLAPPRASAGVLAAIAAVIALVVIGTVWFAGVGALAPEAPSPSAASLGAIDVDSEPAGALVWVDGQLAGQTPARVSRLPIGRAITVRVERAGMTAAERAVTLSGDQPERLEFALAPSSGRARLTGVPGGARVYVDDRAVDVGAPLELSVGPHTVRVESADEVLSTRTVAVRPGEQTIDLGPP